MDRTLRTKYDFEFEKVYIRPKREERKKSYLFTVLVVIGLACFFFMPLLAIAKVPLEAWVPVWFGGIALTAVAARLQSQSQLCHRSGISFRLWFCVMLFTYLQGHQVHLLAHLRSQLLLLVVVRPRSEH